MRQDLLAADRALCWHPYSAMTRPGTTHAVESADGVRLKIAGRGEVVDGMSSWWSAIHGYRHPMLDAAVSDQLGRMSHVMFGGLTHDPAVRLANRLIEIAHAAGASNLQHVFFADSGSVSVEVAIKMALQAQIGRGRPTRRRLMALRGGYHGDTLAAMSVCDPDGGMHAMWRGMLPEQVFLPRPPPGFDRADDDAEIVAWAQVVRATAAQHADDLAAIIAEPVLQGAGGMHIYSPACLRVLREVADEHGLLLILDEIATGFWRTGQPLASAHAGIAPDIVCVGKALTGGYLTLAAALTTPEVAAAIDASPAGALMHGPTFMANPLACSVALANLGLLDDSSPHVSRLESALRAGLQGVNEVAGILDVRVLGGVGVIQLAAPVDVAAATEAALDAGVWLRPFRDLIYAMPPYICTNDELALITAGMRAAAAARADSRTSALP